MRFKFGSARAKPIYRIQQSNSNSKGESKMKSKLTVLFTIALTMVVLSAAPIHSANATPPSPVPASPFVGTWQTTWKATDGRTPSAPVTIRADSSNPNALDGAVEVPGPNGTMYGTLSSDGKTWSGNWWNPDGIHGTFTFTLKDNKNFTGSYTQSGAPDSYDWHGNK